MSKEGGLRGGCGWEVPEVVDVLLLLFLVLFFIFLLLIFPVKILNGSDLFFSVM